METINIQKLIDSDIKFKKIWESDCKNHRVLYFQLDSNEEGIPAHFHPFGEDSAIVVQGELMYDISFEQQLRAEENEIVFGWTNYVHGYHNERAETLHLLIFATPEHNESIYDKGRLLEGEHTYIRQAKITAEMPAIASARMIFSTNIKNMAHGDTLIYDCYKKELQVIAYNEQPLHIQPNYLVIQFKDIVTTDSL
ncbi:cupin domain-containing protein [Bacillus ndiopicus]|uniref:cupin domain-containing protein n=1 Tax=Bacillus ndiopicus TaxID=1347368 RepID=UPI00069438A2|nr:hypothetical protein [Bacillus ndiopicus]